MTNAHIVHVYKSYLLTVFSLFWFKMNSYSHKIQMYG